MAATHGRMPARHDDCTTGSQEDAVQDPTCEQDITAHQDMKPESIRQLFRPEANARRIARAAG